jgi:Glycosyl hydrolase family 1
MLFTSHFILPVLVDSDDPTWEKNAMGWNIVPDGLQQMLRWISERYENPLVFITENGSAEAETEDTESVLNDEQRRSFLESHIRACRDAINEHRVNLAGYFAWSFLDNFEWQFGYQRRFGICHVDYETQIRTPRDSAMWYSDHIRLNSRIAWIGNETASQVRDTQHYRSRGRSLATIYKQHPSNRDRPPRLPTNVLIGYGSNCEAVRRAVHDGVNIVIWSFVDVVKNPAVVDTYASSQYRNRKLEYPQIEEAYTLSTTLNLTAIRNLVDELYTSGYENVLHFASVGGWNGAHIDTDISAFEWYQIFNQSVGNVFDGIDWDLEGNDVLDSPYNHFTMKCLDHVGVISQLAKQGTHCIVHACIFSSSRCLQSISCFVIVPPKQTVNISVLLLPNHI